MTLGPESVLANRYRLLALLGRGGMGEVWRAEQLDLKAQVAVKILNPTLAVHAETLQRFNREAQAAASLRSPHVVQILEHGVDPTLGVAFIAMELMEGESLAQRLRRVGRLSVAETTRIITHVARALTRAHEAGIVHRDLKPDNVFLVANEDEEVAKVLDFGVAKAPNLSLDTATRTGAVMGTPYYMSPEQISGEKGVDFRTDLWALGIIACECLSGRRPFEGESLGGLAIAICTKPAPRPSSLAPLPAAFDTWFERAIARDPSQRFQSARELADELKRALHDQAGAVVPPSPPTNATVKSASAASVSSVVPLSRTAPAESPTPKPRPQRSLAVAGALLTTLAVGSGVWAFRSAKEAGTASADGSADAAVPKVGELTSAAAPTAVIAAPPPAASELAPTPLVVPVRSAAPSAAPSPIQPPARTPRSAAPKPKTISSPSPSAKPVQDEGSIFDRRKG